MGFNSIHIATTHNGLLHQVAVNCKIEDECSYQTFGAFGVYSIQRPYPQQIPKESILPTRNKNIEKSLTFFKVNKTDYITFDTIDKK